MLTAAETDLIDGDSGEFAVAYSLGGQPASNAGVFTLADPRSDFTYTVPSDPGREPAKLRTILIGSDAYSLPTIDGEPQECWYHMSQGDGAGSELAAVPPPVLALIEPRAGVC